MQVIIEEVVSRVRSTHPDAVLSPSILRAVVEAVMQAIEARDRRTSDRNEELSLQNYQQRNVPGSD